MEYMLFIVAFFALAFYLGYLGYKGLRKKERHDRS